MKNLKALPLAGLVLASASAHSAFILDLPEEMTFTRGDSQSAYEIPHLLDLDYGNPDTITRYIENTFSIGGGTLGDLPYQQTGFVGVDSVEDGLKHLLFGRPIGPDAEGNMRYEPTGVFNEVEVGVDYTFSVFVQAFLYDRTSCTMDPELFPSSCEFITSGLEDTMTVRFIDPDVTTDVPVGPTAPLLAAGMAGLWLRRKLA